MPDLLTPDMTDSAACVRLNDLLINLGRSLLQYAGEAWPWSAARDGGDLRATVDRLRGMQGESVRALAELLAGEGHPVDFGVFPDEYTSLHYVSLRYLIEQLVANEQAIAAECRAVAAELEPRSPARELVDEIVRREEAILGELQSLREP